ncbi:MAG: hypothetical protein MI724_12560, partial [Spirochaetales bacterium]|nr:hypothetical protein [Spirochaetales bacterium]
RNREGYANLCRIVSVGQAASPKGECAVSVSELCKHSRGLIALWIYRDSSSTAYLETLRRGFDGCLYAVVTRHREERDAERERLTRSSAGRLGIPLVAATEVLYHERGRRRLYDVLTCISRSTTLDEAGTNVGPNAEHHLRSPHSMTELFADAPLLMAATADVADRCRFSLRDLSYRYPDEKAPEGYTTMEWLRHLTFEGARARYGDRVPMSVAEQVDKELTLIEELGYAGYFLTVHGIVRFCERSGILCQGRGSAANSAVCYCLGVTAIDPVKMDLLFERFLSRERDEPPDIDIDIEHARREEVIQHLYERYGRDRAAMVANVIRYRPKSAVREVGKVLGVAQTALDRCAKLLSHWDSAIDESTAHASLDLSSHRVRLLLEIATELIGFPRHLSIHPGGFLLGNESIDRLVPIEPATMPGRTVIQWDKDDIETLKLFKVDVLGLGALTHAHLCFDLIERHYGRALSLATIPSEDDKTFDMVCRADT